MMVIEVVEVVGKGKQGLSIKLGTQFGRWYRNLKRCLFCVSFMDVEWMLLCVVP